MPEVATNNDALITAWLTDQTHFLYKFPNQPIDLKQYPIIIEILNSSKPTNLKCQIIFNWINNYQKFGTLDKCNPSNKIISENSTSMYNILDENNAKIFDNNISWKELLDNLTLMEYSKLSKNKIFTINPV